MCILQKRPVFLRSLKWKLMGPECRFLVGSGKRCAFYTHKKDVFEGKIHLAMGWLQLVASLKLYLSFAEYCLCYRALLQKRRRPQYKPLSPSWTNSSPTLTCAPTTRGQGLKTKFSTVVRHRGDLWPPPRRFSPFVFFLDFVLMGTGPQGPVPPPPLEWTSFLPLVTAVSQSQIRVLNHQAVVV